VEQPPAADDARLVLGADSLLLVTGEAGGSTSAIVADLAAASGGTFYLLDLVEAPAADDRRVALFRTDKEALKQELIAAARAAGERPTPALIDKQLLGVERAEAALRAVEAVQAAGGTAVYRAVNLLDAAAVTAVVDEIRAAHGKIDAIVHAGGLEISRPLDKKAAAEFDLVFDVKADGLFSLLRAARGLPIGAVVAFSSVAGRFGNAGQTDYSAANDLLCKVCSSLRRWRPETRGIAIDWTAWGGIGMATRGSIPRIMEMAGIEMLAPEVGIPVVRQELQSGGGELVVGGALGSLTAEWDAQGGLDAARAADWLRAAHPDLRMVGDIKAAALYGGWAVETPLDPAAQPFLYDHAPDAGTPWLPGVMATEALAELAAVIAPGYHVAAVENVEMSGAFKFFRNAPRTLHLWAQAFPAADGRVRVRTALRSVTPPAREGLPAREQTHFAADVWLQEEAPEAAAVDFTPPADGDLPITAEVVYDSFFHGPAYRVIARAAVGGETAVCRFAADLPPNSAPDGARTLMAPRLVELCFQAAALWTQEVRQAMGFPLGIGRVTAYRQPAADGPALYGLVETADGGDTFDGRVVDADGTVYVELRGYRTVARPM
ncbi:MAG: SDR family NAD(P)-dependent oxidoreductase, partial [Anaerolineales bacterium]|nr:SDR family NAD(P)-dependent oxidoreductase [Anaerolineales bacterium]